MKWSALSPSNLALIKYMGKGPDNLPLNSSLSFTLNHLVTKVTAEEAPFDSWSPFDKADSFYTALSLGEQKRFLNFFKFLKERFSIPGHYRICSGSNFPLSAGMAGSASAFSALTRTAYHISQSRSGRNMKFSTEELAQISRRGSGSSCRSFFSPWALWRGERIKPLKFPFKNFIHQAVAVENSPKKIPSGSAHERVKNSLRFRQRPERAEGRLTQLCSALKSQDWPKCFSLVKEEFLDVHELFETSRPPFTYQTENSRKIVRMIENFWERKGDGPLITMDAGSSVHLLYRGDQEDFAEEIASRLSRFLIFRSDRLSR